MNKNQLAEKLLLLHPNVVPYYRIRYELYKLLNVDFDLFFTEDIYNYNNNYYVLKRKKMLKIVECVECIYPHDYKIQINQDISISCIFVFNYYTRILIEIPENYISIFNLINSIFSKIPFDQKQINIINYLILNNLDIRTSENNVKIGIHSKININDDAFIQLIHKIKEKHHE